MQNLDAGGDMLLLNESTLPIIEQIAQGMPGGFFIYHADGNEELIYINRSMLRIFGCKTQEEFRAHTGNSFKGIVHPDDIDEVERSIARQIASNRLHFDYVEYRIVRKDGTVRWVEDYGHFMHTRAYGDIFYVFIDDATERLTKRLAELEEVNRKLRRAYAQEAQYKRALLHDAVMVFEFSVTRDEFLFPVSEGNAQWLLERGEGARFERYSQLAECLARHAGEGEEERCRSFFRLERLRDCYRNGEPEQLLDGWLTDAGGVRRLMRYTILMGSGEDADVFAVLIAKDITNTAEHQKLLELAWKRAETAGVARNTFLNNISHDIRTPLNGLLGCTDLMARHLDDREKQEEYLAKIRSFGEQLCTIWNEALELTHMESGQTALEEQECDLQELLEELERTTRRKAAEKNLRVCAPRREFKDRWVVADGPRLREILWQVLDNAVKYTRPGGTVTFTAQQLHQAPQGWARYRFTVEDTGIGMHPEFLDKIFEPFERENNSTKSGVFGSGLGLPVAKSLADLMGGTLQASSELGKGSVFTAEFIFRLKDKDACAALAGSDAAGQGDLSGRRILLVEDNEINREITQELLSDLGAEVDMACDGAVSLEKVRSSLPRGYDLILMDIQMPVMNGYEATRAIRALEDPALSGIPIVALSADAFVENQKMAMQAGMNAHCPKPLDIQNLCAIMERIFSAAPFSLDNPGKV